MLIIIPTLLYVPKYVLTYTQLSKDLQMILSYFISILGIAFYLFLLYGKEKGIDITYLTVHGEKEISDTLAVYEAVLSKMI
ncbi:putative membrane protein [Caldibacillus thermoamylovorans]|uniref:Putative membrane protein n=1 Tax=Caldibacillus thermoamylovorans TaxID=35841 RepID=A0A090ISA5_9BACI|nr:putative membrane protein [Caldibacillus thermoamylovorans]